MVQAVDRALDVLEAASAAPDGLTLQALVEATGLRPTTTHNLAATLVERGYLSKTSRPTRYHAGPALQSLATTAHGTRREAFVESAVRQLHGQWPRATVTSAADRAGDATVTARMSPEQPRQMQHPAYQVLAPYDSVSALVFQAFWPEERRAAYRLRYPFGEYGPPRWPDEPSLGAFLDEVRREGRALLTDNGTLLRVAVPVFSAGRELFATLGVAVPVDPEDADGQIDRLVDAMSRISQEGRTVR